MKLNILATICALFVIAGITACKDDELPVAGIRFESGTQSVTESDGTFATFHPELVGPEGVGRVITVKLVFDRPLAGDVTLKLDVGGTASDQVVGDDQNDFEILGDGEQLEVNGDQVRLLQNAEEASLRIVIFEDLHFEADEDEGVQFTNKGTPYETIELTLESIVSGPGTLGTTTKHTIQLLEDDIIATLVWDALDYDDEAEAEAEVDMDMVVFMGPYIWEYLANRDTDFEQFFIPAGLPEGDVEISYTYFSGNSDNLGFAALFFNTAGTLEGSDGHAFFIDDHPPLLFEGNYSLANIRPYNLDADEYPLIAQTAVKDGINYANFSQLEQFAEGSRVKPTHFRRPDRTVLKELSRMKGELKRRK